jgi:hypothetical protein
MYPTAMIPTDVGVFADPRDVGELAEPLRSRIYTAINHAPTRGLVLVSGKRSPWQQYLLRVGRVGASRAFNPNYPGSPRTALPYRSNHQRGTAADMGGRELGWLIANETRYGLARTVSSENWHFEAVGTPTAIITPYPGSTPAEPEEPFTVAQFEEIMAHLTEIETRVERIEGKQREQSDSWLKPTTERVRELKESLEDGGTIDNNRLKPTTQRVRRIQAHLGIPDHD